MIAEDAPRYVGIDLGTSNSAAAVFDGKATVAARNAQGAALTPSVVRIDARGNVLVGVRAARFLDADPENTHAGFKRLMGAGHDIAFTASQQTQTPTQLSAEVLRALRQDIAEQFGFLPNQAVISVPALFELHQTAATAEAAHLAGFERVELIQEPIASAIAAGWTDNGRDGPWLVYDLGGGTFDASLLETQDGLLRVVGHDGDNFLGGRDFDRVLIDLALADVHAQGVVLDVNDPDLRVPLQRLRAAAEEVKIELSRAREATFFVSGLTVGERTIEVDCSIARTDYEQRITPLIDRSIEICLRLLASHGLRPEDLARLVLVGGPTMTPHLRTRVGAALLAPIADGLDPMTLVAQGAALYAGTLALDGRPRTQKLDEPEKPKAWLHHPTVTPDLSPYVVGKLIDPEGRVKRVRIERADGSWRSERVATDADGSFAIMVRLDPKQHCAFAAIGETDAEEITLASFAMTQGVTLGEPPLSRSVGVALADGRVMVFFPRGAPLPIRRTFVLLTAETAGPGSPDHVLKIPLVQGEFALARHCRLVGALEIPGAKLPANLPAGSEIEVMLELDRSGELKASGRVKAFDLMFDEIAVLITPRLSLEAMRQALARLRDRMSDLTRDAFKTRDRATTERVSTLTATLADVEQAVGAAESGDLDAGEKARRRVTDFDAELAALETELAFPALTERVEQTYRRALGWVAQYGDDAERAALTSAYQACRQAIITKDSEEVERQVSLVGRLGAAAYFREPGAWASALERCASSVGESTDIRRATQLVASGREAVRNNDQSRLEQTVRSLWELEPIDRAKQSLAHGSGLRMP